MFRKLSILIICTFFCVNCSSKINQKNFEKLYQSAKTIEGSVSVGINFQKFGELLQNFATEISIARDKGKSEEEKELLKIYLEVLDMYQDSHRLWNFKILLSDEYFYLRGYICVGKGDAIVKKYNFPTFENSQVADYYNRYYIREDSIQIIWAKAQEKLEKANNLYLGK